jgi:exodeoxyribonuclease VII large subunit
MLLLTVSQVATHLKNLLDADDLLTDVWVEGEISNLSRPNSGHYYFTLKDDSAALRVAMWRNNVNKLETPLQNGDAVLAHGNVSIYPARGDLQLYADKVRPAGVGLLHARLEELRAHLDAEGLFDESRKRPLPLLPRRIGVATSADGAALRDILHVLQRRFPLVEVLLAPCLVQGEQAAASITRALNTLYRSEADVVILARGGGSIEDLWSFNEEAVVRAVYASPVPLITGVGHETDTTLVDSVADLRAPTPSAAAELVVPDAEALTLDTETLRQRLNEAITQHVVSRRHLLDDAEATLQRQHPAARVAHSRQQLDDLLRRASVRASHAIEQRRLRLDGLRNQLAALSPAATLQRGYALARRATDGQAITQAAQVQPGETLTIALAEGVLTVQVLATSPDQRDTTQSDDMSK